MVELDPERSAVTDGDREVQALRRAIQELITDLPRLVQAPGIEEAAAAFRNEENPATLAYRVASLLNLTVKEEQTLLILLKPTVLIQAEQEEKKFPGLADSLSTGLR